MRQIHAHIDQRAFRTTDEKEEIDKYFRERKKKKKKKEKKRKEKKKKEVLKKIISLSYAHLY